jgi:hypothetical protein
MAGWFSPNATTVTRNDPTSQIFNRVRFSETGLLPPTSRQTAILHAQLSLVAQDRGLSRAMLSQNGRQEAPCSGFVESVRYFHTLRFVFVDCFLDS